MSDLVLIDTCIWVPFFSRSASPHKTAVGNLLDDNRAALVGPILAEILLGFKRDVEADWVASSLEGLHFIRLEWNDWKAVAALDRKLVSLGHRLPLSDVTLAASALSRQIAVYTIDPHFDLIPGLKRFEPKK